LSDIQTADDLLPSDLHRQIVELGQGLSWKYGWRSRRLGDRFTYWHSHIAGKTIDSRESCLAEVEANPLYGCLIAALELAKQRFKELQPYYPARVYANGHTYGNEGYLHQDHKPSEDARTLLIYAHAIWARNWGGETLFFKGENIVASVYPKPGRVAVFPAHIDHVARTPSRESSELRITIAYKLFREDGHDTEH
jgi:SM-20-related protein